MFDPNLPATDSDMVSAEMRSQFNGLKALIDAILTVTAAQVDGVTTLDPGLPANATVSVVGNTLHFSFEIPRGNEGPQGGAGPAGGDGGQGPPFAQAVVDAVNTLPAGSAATVDVTFDGTSVRFTFGIPQGNDGATGAAGPPGEVMQVDLDNGLLNTLAQTSANTNAVSTLDSGYSDLETEELRNKVNELINAMRR
jgi:hypothetical protein